MRQTTLAAPSRDIVHVDSPGRLRLLAFATVILTLTRFGAYWDVQWHWAVGRDSFFIPPHDLIYTGVAVSGLLGLSMVWCDGWRHRFANAPIPWGWLIQMIGAGITVAAAPFDDLWHRRYGIDVTIWSPPHMVGVLGARTMNLGLFISWALALGAISGFGGWAFAQWLLRGAHRGRAWKTSGRIEATHPSRGTV